MVVKFNPYIKLENLNLYKNKLASNTNKNQYEVCTFYEKSQKLFVSYVYELELGEKTNRIHDYSYNYTPSKALNAHLKLLSFWNKKENKPFHIKMIYFTEGEKIYIETAMSLKKKDIKSIDKLKKINKHFLYSVNEKDFNELHKNYSFIHKNNFYYYNS